MMLVSSGLSQSVINTEKLFKDNNDGLAFAAELTGSALAGNAQVFIVEFSLNTAYKKNKNQLLLLSGGEFIKEEQDLISNTFYGQVRYEYQVHDKGKLFAFYQLQRNEILLILRRQLLGVGYKHSLVNVQEDSLSKFKIDVSLGAMQEEELLDEKQLNSEEIAYTNYTRGISSLVVVWNPTSNFSVINTSYFQSYLKNVSDFRVLNETNLVFNLSKWISFSVDLEYRFDSAPPVNLRNSDVNLNFGLLLNL